MTSKRTPAALRIKLSPSRFLLVFLLLQHVLAGAALAMTSLRPGLLWASAAVLSFSLAYQLVRCCSSRVRPQTLRYHEGVWELEYFDRRLSGQLASRWRLPWIIGLTFTLPGTSRTLLVPADSCSPEDFRRLQLWSGFTAVAGVKDRIQRLG